MKVVIDGEIGDIDVSKFVKAVTKGVSDGVSKALNDEVAKAVKGAGGEASKVNRVGTSDSTSKLMSYQMLTKPLEDMMLKFTEKISSGMKESGMGAAGAGIGAILQLVLGEALDQMVSILQNIVKILLMILGIGIPLKIIADTISAFMNAFNAVGKVWDDIFAMITKMVQPFANLIIPLLIPFLYLFGTIARILNLALLPFFTAMMKIATALGQNMSGTITTVMGDVMQGNFGKAITDLIAGLGNSFKEMANQITTEISPLLTLLAKFIMDFLTLNLDDVHKVIDDLLGKQLGDMVNALIDILYKAVSAIAGFIAQIIGKDAFDKMFGAGAFDNVVNTNSAFAAGKGAAETLQLFIKGIGDFADYISKGDFGSAFKTVAGLLATAVYGAMLVFISAIKDVVDTLIKMNNPTINSLMEAMVLMAQGILVIVMTTIPNIISTFEQLILGINTFIASLKLTSEQTKYNLGLGSDDAVKEAQSALTDSTFKEATFKPETAGSIYGDALAKNMKDLSDGLGALYTSLTTNDVKGALEANAKIFGNLTLGLTDVYNSVMNSLIKDNTITTFSLNLSQLSDQTKSWSDKMAEFDPAQAMRDAITKMTQFLEDQAKIDAATKSSSGTAHNDFIWRPGSGATAFSPDDTIIGVKDPSKLGGSGSVTNNYYINGNGDKFLTDTIKSVIQQKDARDSRYGFYQQGR